MPLLKFKTKYTNPLILGKDDDDGHPQLWPAGDNWR